MDASRPSDIADISFLEAKVREDFGARLTTATPAQAQSILAQYADYVVCERALENRDPAVQSIARKVLAELAAQGDRFSQDILARIDGCSKGGDNSQR